MGRPSAAARLRLVSVGSAVSVRGRVGADDQAVAIRIYGHFDIVGKYAAERRLNGGSGGGA